MPNFEITLQKPLGIAFGEKDGGGLQIDEMLPEGSAAADGTSWPRDLLLEVNGEDVSSMPFDDVMERLIAAPESVELRLGRVRGRTAALRFPNREQLYFTKPGDSLKSCADVVGFPVKYNCGGGSCGSCAFMLRDGEGGGMQPVRFCKAGIPDGEDASLMPIDVLSNRSPEAKAYYKELEDKANSM